ncbi:MAG: AbrB/MazE/SpoVT family DNA-binding domain-containing protein [Chloroflexi bacterium]|nr:AbrB/MazE/SpoVT family DNA-binding domain-containing protein [Chloroflexota bacterium]
MNIVKIGPKGQVTIPANLRAQYNLRPGSRVVLVDYGGVLTIVPAMSDPIEESAGLLKDGPSPAAALRAERKRERARGR